MTRNDFLEYITTYGITPAMAIQIDDDLKLQAAWSTFVRSAAYMQNVMKVYQEAKEAESDFEPEPEAA